VLEDLDREFLRSRRLISKFHWVADPVYCTDRESSLYSPRGKTAPQVDTSLTYLIKYAQAKRIDISYEDLKALAVGSARGYTVITDDGGMQQLAELFAIECWPTLKLMKLMLDCKRIDLDKVKEVVEYWNAEDDLPRHIVDFRKLYVECFNGKCPI
jgi:hypothetical protein